MEEDRDYSSVDTQEDEAPHASDAVIEVPGDQGGIVEEIGPLEQV
jgi:hypothetical protein